MAATLDKIYNNPEDVGSYASVEAIYKRAKAEIHEVSNEVKRYKHTHTHKQTKTHNTPTHYTNL